MRRLGFVLFAALSAAPLACEQKPELSPEELAARIASKLEEADVRQRNNKPKDAESIYNWILQEEANHAGALRGLAQIRLAEGDLGAARELAEKAAAAGGSDPQIFAALGKINDKEGKFAQAATAWGKAYELEAGNSVFGLNQGIALRMAKQYDQAEAVLRKVADQDPEVQFVYTELGDTLREKNQLDDALKLYMKAQTIFASDRRAHAGAAQVYELKGDTTRAINEWSNYVRMDCCSNYSNEVAKPQLEALRQKEQAELAAGGGAAEGAAPDDAGEAQPG